jgi:MFS family permease
MLGLSTTVSPISEEEFNAEVEKNLRWNYAVNFMDGATFWFGLSFMSASTILPLFVTKLTDNPLWIALLAMIAQASWYLPQLFVAAATERQPIKKVVVVNVGFFTERLPIWLLPIAALVAAWNVPLALFLFFVGFASHGLGAGAIAPAWTDMLARIFPVNRRASFFGITSFIGTGLGTAGALLSSWLLIAFPFPTNFFYVFLVAATSITVSWAFIAFTREPAPVIHTPQEEGVVAQLGWAKVQAILKGDDNFRRFLSSRLLGTMAAMGVGFLTVAAIRQWDVSDALVGWFTAALLLGQTVGNLIAGFTADRYGHRITLLIGLLFTATGYVLAILSPAAEWYLGVFFVMGIGAGINIVSGILGVLEFTTVRHRPTYVGLSNTTAGLGSVVAPIIGGLLASWSFTALFAISALMGLAAAYVLKTQVTEPRTIKQHFDPDRVIAAH